MTKEEMLHRLDTSDQEWNSYLAKASKFVTETLTERERELHKRIYSQTFTPLLIEASPADISELFKTQEGLVGVITAKNGCCGL